MHRLAHTGGTKALLHWLSVRSSTWTAIVDAAGAVLLACRQHFTRMAAELAVLGAAELTSRGVRSVVLDSGESIALIYALGVSSDADGPILVAIGDRPDTGLPTLLADAVVPLTLCWKADEAERERRRVELADARAREAVLHLLMTGQVPAAHQIASVLRPSLPDPLHVCVIEYPAGLRAGEAARLCAGTLGRRAWIIPCPVYSRHVIVLAPPAAASTGGHTGPLPLDITPSADGCFVGVSEEVPLGETAAGYAQAFHALAVARRRTDRYARFGTGSELALVARADGAVWAETLLAPLRAYTPGRPQDPDSHELTVTAQSWLNFGSRAARCLKVHRNTVAVRLRRIEELLELDLGTLPDQAALSLALRLTSAHQGHWPGPVPEAATNAPRSLDGVLAQPSIRQWAGHFLRPVTSAAAPAGAAETLRVWLDHDGQLKATAAALGISVPGARKRLVRLEAAFERSLLQAPSAQRDLWLARRSMELAPRKASALCGSAIGE
ncbi:helix-turn-helix domain-containing protein [Streptomyces sp. NPDC001404]|uniref:helix-turn-helix domain-containing protein n=1 Tax=Streptomyces sp. NPDC001404 TaxID=3364571 RepID=UPI0036AD74D3